MKKVIRRPSNLRTKKPQLLRLEPRIMFDGAAVDTTVEVAGAQDGGMADPAHTQIQDAMANSFGPAATGAPQDQATQQDQAQPLAGTDQPAPSAADSAQPALAGTDIDTGANTDITPLLDLTDSAEPHQALLGDAAALTQQKLLEWVNSDAFRQQAAEIFSADAGSAQWNAQLDALHNDILNGSYSLRTEVRSNAEMQGLLGAFSASGGEPTLYLNAAYLDKASATQVSQVLIEEIGHSIDHQLNRGQDSLGDEGHAFAALVIGGNADLAANQIRDDHHVLTLDGQAVSAEAADAYNIAQTHFVPMPEDQIWSGIQNVYSGSTDNKIESIIAITATSKDTYIVYDHWEDGYEADIKNPVGTSTRIWYYDTDGKWVDVKTNTPLADGETVGNVTAMGQTLILRNQVNKNSMATVDFDGGDKIGSTKAISVTRAGWDTKIGTIVGGAVNLIDVGNAGTSYVIPVGTNTAEAPKIGSNSILQKDSLFIMAYENNTVVTVNLVKADGSSNGSITRTLQQGQSWYIGGLASGATVAGTGLADAKAVINEGTTVTTTGGKIGVNMLSGSNTSQNRWYGIAPTESWGNSYYAPVATVGSATSHIYLFNNNTTDITVKYETLGAGGVVEVKSVTVAAGKSKVVAMPTSAGHFYSADGKAFYAVATVDPTTSRDWSYSLVAERTLTDRFVVAWGPGNGDANPAGKKNGSPVWVTAVDDTYLYIDSATTELRDAANNVIAKDVAKSAAAGPNVSAYKVDRLQSYRLRDTSDNNQTGLVVYTLDGTLITAAWGEDASVADTGSPYLDMGTTISPYPDYVLEKKAAEIVNKGRVSGVIEAGDEVKYTITLTNRAVIQLFNMNIQDSITPAGSADYVANSLELTSYDESGNKVWVINAAAGTKTWYLADGTIDASKGTNGIETDISLSGDNFDAILGATGNGGSGGYLVTDNLNRDPAKTGLQIGGFIQFTYRVTIKTDISKELADANFVVSNSVKLTAPGVDKDKVNNIDLSGTITDGVVTFISASGGSEVTSFEPGNEIWIRVTDNDQNKNATTEQTLKVTLTNTTTGEKEIVTLYETGDNTGIFEGSVSTTRGTGNDSDPDGDGKFKLKRGDEIKVEYTDPFSGNSADPSNGIDNPTNWGINSPNYKIGENNNVKTALVEDSGISVNDILVNEASPYGVFTVQGAQGQEVKLALGTTGSGAGHATSGDDYTNSLEYFDVTDDTWKTYNPGNTVEIRDPDGTLLVRNPIINDSVFEGAETYQLKVTPYKTDGVTPGSSTTGTATILDDGTGDIYDPTDGSKTPSDPGDPAYVPHDHDRFPQVDNPVVNEASGHVVFTVTTQPGDKITKLDVANGTATGGATGHGTTDGSVDYLMDAFEYSTDGGSSWIAFTPGTALDITSPSDGKVLVRTTIVNDTSYEQSETFTLTAETITGGKATGTATIKDDGTGTGGTDDDRGAVSVKVNNPVVNEASGHVVFEVKNDDASPVDVALALNDGTGSSLATGSPSGPIGAGEQGSKDYRNDSFEYWDGSAWVEYTSEVTIAANGTLYVRVAIYNDTTYEGAETFDLVVTPQSASAVTGTATILDDGTGDIFDPTDPSDPGKTVTNDPDDGNYKPRDDDRTPVVNNPIVNEGSPYIVFEVTTTPKAIIGSLVLNDGTAKGGTTSPTDGSVDYGSNALQYSTDGGVTWADYSGGSITAPTDGKVLVRTTVVNDNDYEVSENFRLTVTLNDINTGAPTGNSATGVGTILDDGTGDIFNSDGTKNPGATKDDDRPVSVNSPTVNEGSGWIVFEVGGIAGTPIASLVLADGTGAAGAKGGTATDGTSGNIDFKNDSLQYFNGTTWVAWSADTPIPAGGTLLVRVAIFNDGLYENAETFTLKATTKGGIEATGTGTIKDDGTGDVWNPSDPDNPDTGNVTKNPPGFVKDDDRTISITDGGKFDLGTKVFAESPVREDVQYTYFKVTDVAEGIQVKLAVANTSTALTLQPPMQFSTDNGTTWQTYSDANKPVAPSTGKILVRVDISSENDDPIEPDETFKLTASYANNPAKHAEGTGTITDKLAKAPKITPDDMNGTDDPENPNAKEKTGEITVYEHGLKDSSGKQTATGTLQVEAEEGIKEIILGDDSFTLDQLRNGQGTITTPLGTLKVTGVQVTEESSGKPTKVTLTYTYTLHTPDDHSVASGKDDTATTEEITIGVKDASTEENTAESKITVSIIDDVPKAVNDVTATTEGTRTITGNVFTNDSIGADGPGEHGPVTKVQPTTVEEQPEQQVGAGPATVTGQYGTLTLNPDGSYSYVVDDTKQAVKDMQASGVSLTETFTYTIRDADGDESPATLTITLRPILKPADDRDSTMADTPVTTTVLVNDGYAGSKVSVSVKPGDEPAGGRVTVNPDGSITYLPNPGFTGIDTYFYTVTTEGGVEQRAMVTISVAPPPPHIEPVAPVEPPPYIAPPVPEPMPPSPGLGLEEQGEMPPYDIGKDVFDEWSVPQQDYELLLEKKIPDQPVEPGKEVEFLIPQDTFRHTDPSAKLTLVAAQLDGSPLPDWLVFDSATGGFSGTPPEGFSGEVLVRVVARDGANRQAETIVRLGDRVEGKAGEPAMPPYEVGRDPAANSTEQAVDYELLLEKKIPDQPLEAGKDVDFLVPKDTFRHTDPSAKLSLSAAMVDGSPLPDWLVFDSATGGFKGTPPAGAKGELLIRVVAKDEAGRQVETIVRISDQVEPSYVPSIDPSIMANGEHVLQVAKGVPDLLMPFEADGAASIEYVIPMDAFVHSDAGAQVELSVMMADGSPLPNWLVFDSKTGKFTGIPPKGFKGELQIKVIARDQDGRQAETTLRIKAAEAKADAAGKADGAQKAFGGDKTSQVRGKPSFTDQLKTQGSWGWKAGRDHYLWMAGEVDRIKAERESKAG